MDNVDSVLPPDVLASNPGGTTTNASYGASLTSDIASFEGALDRASSAQSTETVVRELLEPLGVINTEAAELAEFAKDALASGDELSPGEIVALTVKSQEFMFHSQLTANVANRTADGIQQLFRQQG